MNRTCLDLDEILAELKRLGWVLTKTHQGHYRCVPPDKSKPVIHISTDRRSGWGRALRNIIQDLRRGGYSPRPRP